MPLDQAKLAAIPKASPTEQQLLDAGADPKLLTAAVASGLTLAQILAWLTQFGGTIAQALPAILALLALFGGGTPVAAAKKP